MRLRLVFGVVVAGVVAASDAGCSHAAASKSAAEQNPTELARLERDSAKVDKSIDVTRNLIDASDGEKYLPDLYMRLAELYVEKSRIVFFQVLEEAHADDKAVVETPLARLWKDEAIGVYRRILAEFPDYPDNDKVTFFLAHEYRELGNFPEMEAAYRSLADKYPKPPFPLEACPVPG